MKAKKANELASTFKDYSTEATKSRGVEKKQNKKVEIKPDNIEHEILTAAGGLNLLIN